MSEFKEKLKAFQEAVKTGNWPDAVMESAATSGGVWLKGLKAQEEFLDSSKTENEKNEIIINVETVSSGDLQHRLTPEISVPPP